jgi:D-serine deaminase-like pyridoxal phosphate-dependent protein
MKSNIAAAISMVGDPARLRPHIKTHKSLEAAQMMLDAGITKFKCATIAEAELLGMLYAPDVLLAYQPVGPKVDRLFSLIERYPLTQYSCLVDHPDAVLAISNIASKTNSTVNVYLDIDVGMHRTGILPESAYSLFELCNQNPGISVKGLHAYDGHIRDSDLELRKQHADEAILPVYKLLGLNKVIPILRMTNMRRITYFQRWKSASMQSNCFLFTGSGNYKGRLVLITRHFC